MPLALLPKRGLPSLVHSAGGCWIILCWLIESAVIEAFFSLKWIYVSLQPHCHRFRWRLALMFKYFCWWEGLVLLMHETHVGWTRSLWGVLPRGAGGPWGVTPNPCSFDRLNIAQQVTDVHPSGPLSRNALLIPLILCATQHLLPHHCPCRETISRDTLFDLSVLNYFLQRWMCLGVLGIDSQVNEP